MSVAAKKRAKALRERYGVASGVTQAIGDDAGRVCQVIDEPVVMQLPSGGSFNAIMPCENMATLVAGDTAYCQTHWARECAPKRR
jgi:hypothetical protein